MRWRYVALWLCTFVVVAFTVAACQQTSPQATPIATLPPLPQNPNIQAYFNHSLTARYSDPYRKIERDGDNFEQIIIDAIASAQTSIDMAVQEFRLPKIAEALIQRYKQGLRVRLVIENTYNHGWTDYTPAEVAKFDDRKKGKYEEFIRFADLNGDGSVSDDEANQRDSIRMLRNAQFPYLDDTADGSRGSGLMHHKFLVVDGETVVVTSANFTMSDVHGDFNVPTTFGNANNLVKIRDRPVAKLFTDEFNIMWGDGPGGQPDSRFGTRKPARRPVALAVGGTPMQVKFSPDRRKVNFADTSNGLIHRALSSGSKSVDLALFVFSEPRFSNLLEQHHQQGVQVRVLVEPKFAYREYSSLLDLWGYVSTQDCRAEGNQRPWAKPIDTAGVPNLPDGDMLHHKYGVVDGATVVTGSHNWSIAANHLNDETVLVIEDPVVAAHFQREFERLYRDSRRGAPKRVVDTAAQDCQTLRSAQVGGQKRRRSRRRPSNRPQEQPTDLGRDQDDQIEENAS
ncbi:MAG: phosphatidylserine/phosphatidylglycerophosphate/cardiolipin synthase family protein [Oscillatoriales cyanobacterium SM2_2_1]|nr:phosphatidylserine/phosphatidylglycerophosphate/cardiolipin synthase family protein [Oscillatoriales cyanobacterium SM2_2_1]